MAVLADKCPHIQIEVVDLDEEKVKNWNDNDLVNCQYMNLI